MVNTLISLLIRPMKRFFILVSFGLTLSANAQNAEDTVVYSKIYDNPEYFWIGGGASYDLSLNQYNMTLLAFGIDATVMHPKFSLNLYSRYHLGERLTNYGTNGQPRAESIYEKEHSRDISFLGSYYLTSSIKDVEQTFTLKKSGNTTYVSTLPALMDTRLGIDVGLSGGFTYYNFGDATIDGINSEGTKITLASQDENQAITTYFTQKVLRVGLSRVKTTDARIKTDLFGVKEMKDYTKIYMHAQLGFGQSVDDILIESNFARFDINTRMRWLPYGFAMGYEYYSINSAKNRGSSWIAEFGLMPGPFESYLNNFYLDVKLRFHFGKSL